MPKIAVRLFSKATREPSILIPGPRPRPGKKSPPRPLMLGVVGDSGCGKSTLVRGLKELFGKGRVTEICLDDYHRYDRAERARLNLTALDPAANHLELMTEHLALLREGKRVLKPVYDHATGRFAHPEAVMPRPVVIVHGLLTFFTPQLADLFDLRVYLDPEESLRLEWKTARDTLKRGYDLAEVLRQIEERRPDARAYIHPQKAAADLVISFRRPVSLLGNTALDVRLSPCPGWNWPALQLEGSGRTLVVPPGHALEISGRLDGAAAERLAHLFSASGEAALRFSLDTRHPLKGLGLYHHNGEPGSHPEQRQSLPLALTQLLVAGRLTQPAHILDESNQVA